MISYDYLYDKEYFRERCEEKHFKAGMLSYKIYDNAYVAEEKGDRTRGGVYKGDGEFVVSSTKSGTGKRPRLSLIDRSSGEFSNETVIYLGLLSMVWGHAMTDSIMRLWFLRSEDYLHRYKDCRLLFLYEPEKRRIDNIFSLLKILGVDESRITFQQGITQYSKVIVPDESFFAGKNGYRYYTAEYRNLILQVRHYQLEQFCADRTYEKMYFSHYQGSKKRGNVGEKKLENFFKEQGYKIIYPERYCLKELLNMLANCQSFASTVGSSSFNTVFLPEHSDVVLIPREFALDDYQMALNEIIELNIHFVDASLSVLLLNDFPTGGGPFYYYVSENLRNFFGLDEPCDGKYYRKQLGDFKKYLKQIRVMDDLDKRYVPEYYYRQFVYCMAQLHNSYSFRKLFWKAWTYGPDIVKNALKKIMKKI